MSEVLDFISPINIYNKQEDKQEQKKYYYFEQYRNHYLEQQLKNKQIKHQKLHHTYQEDRKDREDQENQDNQDKTKNNNTQIKSKL
jgi:hypothetical protein